jgi:Arc/MetJ family transcription regulator
MTTLTGEATAMRTTIELRDELRAKLLQIAGRRGEKGFSHLVEEAVDRYVAEESTREEARRLALAARGSLPRAEAGELAARAGAIRETWR